MALGKIFLRLPLKTQIYFALFLITVFCIIIVLLCILLLVNESISSRKLNKKKYFYELQQKIISSNIFFQNICILQYDQIMKMVNTQVYYFGATFSSLTKHGTPSSGETSKKYDPSTYEEELEKSKWDNYTMLYYHCYKNEYYFNFVVTLLDESALLLSKQIKTIRIPFYGEDTILLNSYIFYLYYFFGYFSLDVQTIKEIVDTYGDDKIHGYITETILEHKKKYSIYFEKYLKGELHFFDYMFTNTFSIFENYNNTKYIEKYHNNSTEAYIDAMSFYFIFFNYGSNHMYIINNANPVNTSVVTNSEIIDNYLEFIYNLLMRIEEMDVIPLFYENNTIISRRLCGIFLVKQIFYFNSDLYQKMLEDNNFQKIFTEIYTRLVNGKSTIDDCFISSYIDIFEKKFGDEFNDFITSNVKEIMLYDFDNFYDFSYTESYMYFKIFNSEYGKYFYGMKYQFPNYESLVNFEPTYFSLDKINLYSFVTFYPVYQYWVRSGDILYKCFYMIILLLFYLWFFCCVILFCIAGKIINEISAPIIYLQSLIDGSLTSTGDKKEEKINFNIDENIYNLYILIKNLLNSSKFDVQKFGNSNEHNSENDHKSNKNNNNNLVINQEIIKQSQNIQNDEEKIINNCITIYRDYTIGNKNQHLIKKFSKKVGFKNIRSDEDKNYLYRELMKIVECIEKPFNYSVRDTRKIYKNKKTIEIEDVNNSFAYDENKNQKNKTKPSEQILNKTKKNILYHWYLEAKSKTENRFLDIEKERIQFCKTNYNFS